MIFTKSVPRQFSHKKKSTNIGQMLSMFQRNARCAIVDGKTAGGDRQRGTSVTERSTKNEKIGERFLVESSLLVRLIPARRCRPHTQSSKNRES